MRSVGFRRSSAVIGARDQDRRGGLFADRDAGGLGRTVGDFRQRGLVGADRSHFAETAAASDSVVRLAAAIAASTEAPGAASSFRRRRDSAW